MTPLCVAATFGRISVLSALIEDPRTKLNARCVDHIVGIGRPKSPLELAAIYGHADVVRALVDHPGVRLGTSSSKNWNRSPLAYSIEKCKTEIAFAILNAAIAREKQVDIDPLVDQETSVHAMVNQRFEMQGWTPLHLATSEQCLQIVQRLLDLGADVDAVATIVAKNGKYKSRRPIHSAVQKGNEEIVRALLKSGARRELADDDDETPYVMSDSMRELLQANVGSDSEMDGSSDDGSSDDRQCDENASAYPLTHWRLTEDEMLALSSAQRCFYDPNQPGEADVSHPDSPQYATSSNFNFAQTGPQNMSPQGLWNSGLVNAPQPPLPHLDLMMAYPGERPFLSPFAYGSRGTTATGTPYFKSSSGTPSDSGILRSRKALGSGSMSGVFAPCKSSGVEDPRDRMAPRADDQVDSSHTYECDVAQGGLHEGRFARLFRQHRRESSTGTRSPFSNLSSPGGSIGLTGISEFDMPSEKGMDGRNPFEGFEAFDEEISSVDNGNEEQANTNQPDMDASEAIDDHSTEDAVSSSSSDEELNAPDHVRRTYSVVRSGTETRGMLSQYEAMLVDAVQSGNALHVSTFLYACKMKLPEFNVSAMRIRLEGGEGGELSLPELAIVGAKEGVGEKQMHAVIEALHDGGAQADSIRLMELAFERKLAELNSALLFMEW